MGQRLSAKRSRRESEKQEFYTLAEEVTIPRTKTIYYKIRIDSDEGRHYAGLSKESARLEYMREHHHKKSAIVEPDCHVYYDAKEKKKNTNPNNSPEAAMLDGLMPENSDEEWEPGSEQAEAVRNYFKHKAHKTDVFVVVVVV